ncbi:hypothetical protein AAX26_01161 [Aliarcobacter thereius]|uniref:hypothetical protein n=1 Tax=Aliarcobacter thereius TaxID=544718 RepID=UPI0008286B35|nr:hypothetical protein [Aliarcobacter thereius]OCL86855.1 hypothetical protein AAX26_01161 [Aliarcobacter thereius]
MIAMNTKINKALENILDGEDFIKLANKRFNKEEMSSITIELPVELKNNFEKVCNHHNLSTREILITFIEVAFFKYKKELK